MSFAIRSAPQRVWLFWLASSIAAACGGDDSGAAFDSPKDAAIDSGPSFDSPNPVDANGERIPQESGAPDGDAAAETTASIEGDAAADTTASIDGDAAAETTAPLDAGGGSDGTSTSDAGVAGDVEASSEASSLTDASDDSPIDAPTDAVDAGGDTSNGDAPAEGSANPLADGIQCSASADGGVATCSPGVQSCCITSAGTRVFTCHSTITPVVCIGVDLHCDDHADCVAIGQPSQVCCGHLDNSPRVVSSICAAASQCADATHVVLCDPRETSPCPNGGTCRQSATALAGYYLCLP